MPTTRPRHLVTETDAVAHALDEAAAQWPDAASSRGRLLQLLVLEGAKVVEERNADTARERHRAIADNAGVLTGVYCKNERERLREEWPA